MEHEYGRCGALNLFAAFDTRTGHVYAHMAPRKRQHDNSHRARQSAYAQGQTGSGLAGQASSVCVSLPAGALFVDESGRAMVFHLAAQEAADC